jgi:hypothetical protein
MTVGARSAIEVIKLTAKPDHRDQVGLIHSKNGVMLSKVTHAARPYTAKTARENGASVEGTKALGGWSDGGSFRPCYDRALPLDTLLGAADFNARKPEGYFVPRSALGESRERASKLNYAHAPPFLAPEPPAELRSQVFPWVEGEMAALERRATANPDARDFALKHFLRLLQWLRVVLLQDAAVLFLTHPDAGLFRCPLFTSPAFVAFAMQSVQALAAAEESAQLALRNLPQHVVDSISGLLQRVTMNQEQIRPASDAAQQQMVRRIESLQRAVETGLRASSRARKGRAGERHSRRPPLLKLTQYFQPPRSCRCRPRLLYHRR